MAIVIECLDSNCTHYRLLEDGRCIQQPKAKCDTKLRPESFTEDLENMMMKSNKTIYATRGTFDMESAKQGLEFSFDGTSPKKTKAQQIVDLEKQLVELKKK